MDSSIVLPNFPITEIDMFFKFNQDLGNTQYLKKTVKLSFYTDEFETIIYLIFFFNKYVGN